MYCPKCGKLLPDDAAFCFSCGAPTSGHVAPISGQRPLRSNTPSFILAGTLITLIILIIVAFSLRKIPPKHLEPAPNFPGTAPPITAPVPAPPPAIIHHEQKLFSGSIAVNAHSMYWINFSVEPRMRNALVSGHFQAFGGRQNDIQTVVCSDEDFINFKNGHQARAFYNSGKTTVGDINAALPIPGGGGRYVLAFSNAFSPFSGKTVNGEVTLNYDTLGQ
jgi:hypothetical protein